MGYYIGPNDYYYEGDKINWNDIEVTQRPSRFHKWDGDEWIEDIVARTIWDKQQEINAIQSSFTDTIQMKAIVELASLLEPAVLNNLGTAKWVIEKVEEVEELKQDIEDLQNP